jgi:endonuclease YncB( thermonuclease family)
MKKWMFLVALLNAVNTSAETFELGKKAVLKVYDGDSINIKLRLAHIDTPEIKGKCKAEIELAKKARDYTQSFMKSNPRYSITVVPDYSGRKTGRYGRPMVEVRAGGKYLNQLLVDKGLARMYEGKRRSWCGV